MIKLNDVNNKKSDLKPSIIRFKEIIKTTRRTTISTHIDPDGDAIGSALAMYFFLEGLAVESKVIISSAIPSNLTFLTGVKKINIYSGKQDDDFIDGCDLIIILDLNEMSRLGSVEVPIARSKSKKVIIDHHIEPKAPADLYLIDTEASSTGEILWELIAGYPSSAVSKEIAESLYVAIMTDSGNFRFPRTDADLHRTVAQLIDCGADPVMLYENVYNVVSLGSIRLYGMAYSGLELYFSGKLCIAVLDERNFIDAEATVDDTENLVESLHSIAGVMMGVLITKAPGINEVKVSLRSKGDFSVRDIARRLGGGGHFHAAGARVAATSVNEVKKMIIELAESILND